MAAALASAAAKSLSAWRHEVSYGEFFQPIRLTVQGLAPTLPVDPSSGAATAADEPAAPTTAPQDADAARGDNAVVIPAFESVVIPGQLRRVALNVGGPVWAMDWLPSRVTAQHNDAEKPAEEEETPVVQPKKKKRGRTPACGPGKSERSGGLEKENASENAATNGGASSSPESTSSKGNDAPAEWRFLALSTHPPCEVRDGQVVRPTPPDHYYDVQEGARNLIQIWAVPVPPKAGRKRALPAPRFVYGIEHESGVAWEMQWSPLVDQMPDEMRTRDLLGVLAVVFGDGSLRVFAVPHIPPDRLQGPEASEAHGSAYIEALTPLVTAQQQRIVPLCVRWSLRRWNLLLTGGSDGSIALWNIAPSVTSAANPDEVDTDPIEPQRLFQDADTIGKQDAFDWGNGWAAVRAISWSPFDDFIFATTGNDSLFKVWDIREPRICLRSHRIRSTWGNAIQWINDTSIQISGDQGSIYHYDIVSGSYQKLHFHPQLDSPIWDIQLARREPMPVLLSACASGSIRAAPARKLYRSPQNCVEFCRVTGRKNASVHDEFKELSVSFEVTTILGSSEGMGPGVREFCERDAALHRLRLTSVNAHESPCLLASAGHAGLVLIFEMQSMLDTFISDHFQAPSKKKTGRPKKVRFPFAGATHPVAPTKSASANGQPSGRRHLTLGAFAEAKPARESAKNKKKKKWDVIVTNVEYRVKRDAGSGVDGAAEEEEEEEAEFDDEESESDVSPDLDDDENSDDDRVTFSDNDADDVEISPSQLNPTEVRLMSEYQLDLSEEDAILLAIQMSEADQSQGAIPAAAVNSTSSGASQQSPTMDSGNQIATAIQPPPPPVKGKKKAAAKTKASAKKAKSTTAVAPSATKTVETIAALTESAAAVAQPITKAKPSVEAAKKKPVAKSHAKKQKASPSKKALLAEHEQVMDQTTAFQMIAYQRGLTEEEALMEAIRLSEMDTMRRSSRKRSTTQAELEEPESPATTAQQSPPRRRKAVQPRKTSSESAHPPIAAAVGNLTPVLDVAEKDSATADQDTNIPTGDGAAATAKPTAEDPPQQSNAVAEVKASKPRAKQRKTAPQPPSSRAKTTQSAVPAKPRAADPGKRKKKGAKAPASGRRARSGSLLQGVGGEILSEQEALLMALKTSEIEY